MPLSRQRPATPRGIRADGCTFDCVPVDETDEIACAASGADAPPQAAGIDQRLERHAAVRGLLVFCRPGFRLPAPAPRVPPLRAQAPRARAGPRGLVVAPADETFVHFDGAFAAAAGPFGPPPAGPQLVEDLKGGFVTGKAERPLKLQRGLAGRLGRHPMRAPEPGGERRRGGRHYGAGGQRSIDLATAAA